MKKLYFLIFLFFIYSSFLQAIELTNEEKAKERLLAEQTAYERYNGYLDEIKAIMAHMMAQKLDLQFSGDSGILHEKIEEIGMQFHAPRHATIAEARALQLFVMNSLVDAINAHKEIQPFLIMRPFPLGRVSVRISFAGDVDSYNNATVAYVFNVPETAWVTENINKIFYRGKDPFTGGPVKLHSETYEDAKRLNDAFPIKTLVTHQANGEEGIMETLLNTFEEEIWKEYGISTWSIGWKSNKGIEEIAGQFKIFRRASQEESRQLMLRMIERLLSLVNDNQTLRSHLSRFPFPGNQLKIRLSFSHKKGYQFRDKSMESVVFADNELIYYQSPPRNEKEELDPDPLDLPVYSKESYNEAKEKSVGTPVSLYKFGPLSFFESIYNEFIAWLYWALSIILFFFTYA